MNECCDWHAVCVNENEVTQNNNKYVSYCAECNSVSVCENNIVTKIEGEQKEFYMTTYKDKINNLRQK